jgi:hypothetical protein
LYKLIDDWKKLKLKSFETLSSCRDEAIIILKEDECLNYGRVSKLALIELLSSLKEQKDNLENNLPKIEYYAYYLLTVNKTYIKYVFDDINSILMSTYATPEEEETAEFKIVSRTGFLITEIINYGFSKSFLIRLIRAIFVFNPNGTFQDCWSAFYARILSQGKEDYSVIFKAYVPEAKLENISATNLKAEIEVGEINNIDVLKSINKFRKFLQASPNQRFMVKVVSALDQYQALKTAKSELGIMLDLMHLGYNDLMIDLKESALVINHNQPERADFQAIHFQIDDAFTSSDSLYNNLSEKLDVIKDKPFVAQEVIAKIESAVRYLRAGSEAVELEQKYLNYWIGLENLFSTHDINAKTFLRIREHLANAHLVSYARRNLEDFHKSLKRMRAANYLPNLDEQMNYLLDVQTYDTIVGEQSVQSLLSFRAKSLKNSYLSSKEKRDSCLKKHKNNVERHLTRMYKIRNELVHNAATFQNIENITSNLRYYLVFILNKLIEYFAACQPKIIGDRFIDTNDFFLYQEAVLRSIKEKDYALEFLLRTPHPVEFIL